jgi:type IV secretion system protein TrbI
MSSEESPVAGVTHQTSGIQDRRPRPRGVLPRQVQMWLMAGLAAVILLIIFVTGHSAPATRPASSPPTAAPSLATADQIRSYQQQLAADEARQQQLLAQQSAVEPSGAVQRSGGAPSTPDPIAEERRRREYQSLFSDNIALSRRANGTQPYAESGAGRPAPSAASSTSVPDQFALLQRALSQVPAAPAPRVEPAQTSTNASNPTAPAAAGTDGIKEPVRDENPASGPRLRVLEGTVIEAALINRLDGTFAGPVSCLVTTPVYSHDRQAVLIPAGARVLGTAAPVQTWGDSRLAVSFHRLIMPDGHTYSLDRFKGLDQIGETGLRDSVNRHYLQVFGASLAIGAISGLAQYNARSGLDYSFSDAYRQAAGASLATSTSRVLDRYLNVLPTVTIREGFRIKVYLTNDLDLPAYQPVQGGAR